MPAPSINEDAGLCSGLCLRVEVNSMSVSGRYKKDLLANDLYVSPVSWDSPLVIGWVVVAFAKAHSTYLLYKTT